MENEDRKVKQVIIIDKSKQMNVGKIVSQGSHASLGALLTLFSKRKNLDDSTTFELTFQEDSYLDKWLNGIFTKVCLEVKNEKDMIDIYQQIVDYNNKSEEKIPVTLIEDNGLTCFHGEKTKTCVGIGPYWSDIIDKFTGHLKLFR